MGEPARKLAVDESLTEKEDVQKEFEKNSLLRVQGTLTEELVIGLCGPIGTDIHNVSSKIKDILENEYGYKVIEIRLSRLIERNTEKIFSGNGDSSEYIRIRDLIERGNEIRKKNSPRVLAECAIKRIGVEREIQRKKYEESKDPKDKQRRLCYIIDSIKNKSEYDLLKNVYRDLFYSFGVFSPKEFRVANLKNRGLKDQEIYSLINQDSGEESDYGQSVAITFMLSDFFIRIDNNIRKSLEEKIKRYFHLIYGTDIITPYPDETAMYLAASAAGNSGCLSRQVGAAVTDKDGEVLSVGWNDVPKFGGGVYISHKEISDGSDDHRCKCLDPKVCFNSREKDIILSKIEGDMFSSFNEFERELGFLLQRNLKDSFTPELYESIQLLAKERFKDEIKHKVEECGVKNLIEYSRSIHAEMHAIIKGAQKTSDRMVGGKLFCTTFPCHNCARHIVMAGIHEVYYIEPYSKSLAEKLHSDSITSSEPLQNKVRIMMYDGVSPNRYMDLFKMTNENRKEEMPKPPDAKPRYQLTLEDLKALESLTGKSLPNTFVFTEN
ncbi:MAG: anti-phage dCTP deaminase [Bacteroidales bacterium]|jgi:deoxycytidylate deaminase